MKPLEKLQKVSQIPPVALHVPFFLFLFIIVPCLSCFLQESGEEGAEAENTSGGESNAACGRGGTAGG
jgi:hypothetical protein